MYPLNWWGMESGGGGLRQQMRKIFLLILPLTGIPIWGNLWITGPSFSLSVN